MGFFSGITKVFKKVAKKIKKVAGKVMGKVMKLPIFKQIGSLYSKTFGKLGPFGMIAASLVLPGLGSLISAGWTSLASTLSGTAAGGLMNTVGSWVGQAATTLGNVGTSISDKIVGVFKGAGTSISNGASRVFNAASEWTKDNLPNLHQNLSKAGDWISKKISGPQVTESGQQGLTRGQSFRRPGALEGTRTPSFAKPGSLKSAIPEAPVQVTQQDIGILDTKGGVPRLQSPTAPGDSLLSAQPGVDTTFSGEQGLTRVQSAAAPGTDAAAGSSFARKAIESAGSLLGSMGAETPDPLARFEPATFASIGAKRGGISGQGAVGGQFLTPAQQAFFQQHASLLGQIG